MFSLTEFFNMTWITALSCASLCANYCSTNDINYIIDCHKCTHIHVCDNVTHHGIHLLFDNSTTTH